MAFLLEALAAREGDSLIVHYGTGTRTKTVLIDGGPKSVYNDALKPRLMELRGATSGSLPVRLVIVSHVDDDHIQGIIDLLNDPGGRTAYLIAGLWFNAFEDVLSRPPAGGFNLKVAKQQEAIVADVGQGRSLRDEAKKVGIPMNSGKDFIEVRPTGPNTFDLGDGLSLTVVCPTAARLKALQREWDKYVRERGLKQAAAAVAASVARKDGSVFNLSSIAVLARCEGRSMLLAGDALSDDLLAGLKATKQLDARGHIAVDIFKLPHHGSKRNCSEELFKAVTAKHYVVSTNGDRHKHPDLETLEWLMASRQDDNFTIEFTYEQPKLKKFFGDQAKAGRNPHRQYRDPNQHSILISP
jgi:beta-lactamase superfamily II metal-dependent hydrolase